MRCHIYLEGLVHCVAASNIQPKVSSLFQESLGDVVYAQLPEPDDAVAAGEDCGALESVKARNCSGLPD